MHTKPAGESSNTAGGFLVPDALSNVIAELRAEAGVARAIMQVIPMASDVTRVAKRASGATASFLDENSQATPSDTGRPPSVRS